MPVARRLSGSLGLVALGAFLVADVALVGLALRSTSAPPSEAAARPAAKSGVSAGSASPGTGATDSAPAEDAILEPTPLTLGLVAVDRTTAWRFTTGSCEGGGSTLAVTEDGGESWQPRVSPFDHTVRVRVRDGGSGAFAIGADKDCEPRFRQTDDAAQSWDGGIDVPGAWYRDPEDAAVVGTEAGTPAKPCDDTGVVDLAVDSDSALALCGDGRLRSSATGVKWSDEGSVEGALAVALAGDRTLALVTASDCKGLAVVEASEPDAVLGCAPVDLTSVTSGAVALAGAGDAVWVAAGDTTLHASGDLEKWAGAPKG